MFSFFNSKNICTFIKNIVSRIHVKIKDIHDKSMSRFLLNKKLHATSTFKKKIKKLRSQTGNKENN